MIANQAIFPIATMARALGVSEAGDHAWRKRMPSKKQEADMALLKRVRAIHASSRGWIQFAVATPSFMVLRRQIESTQYTSLAFGNRCREAGVRPSMGSVGDAYDCEFTVLPWGA